MVTEGFFERIEADHCAAGKFHRGQKVRAQIFLGIAEIWGRATQFPKLKF